MKDTKSSTPEQTGDKPKTNNADKANTHNSTKEAANLKNQPTPETSTQSEPDAIAEIKELEDKVAEYYDQLMRSRAELENFKKRTERETAQIRSYANEQFATELLAIKDSLEMGLQIDAKEDAKKLHEGLELTLKLLQQTFEKFGIKEINPKGEVFNPQHHQAMMTQADAAKPPNTVLNVLQKGYLMNERLLRPAMVCVSSESEASTPQEKPTAKKQTEEKLENVENTVKNTKGEAN